MLNLRALVAQLQAQRATVQQRIAEREPQRQDPPAFVKPNRPKPNEPKRPRKQRAAEHHHGRRRERPTRIEPPALDRGPACNYRWQGHRRDYARQVIERPPPQPVEVVEHQVIKRWCPCCAAWRSPTLDRTGPVLGQGRIGVCVIALIAYLVTTLRVPSRRVQAYLRTLHQRTLFAGEITALLHQARRTLHPSIDDLKRQARASPILHGDETTWRENGQNGSIWAFSTPGEDAVRSDAYAHARGQAVLKRMLGGQDETTWRENGQNGSIWAFSTPGEDAVRSYAYAHARGQAVLKRMLGGQFEGHLASDFSCGEGEYAGKHQRGWVPLLRDLHALKDQQANDADVRAWAEAVGACYDTAQTWLKQHRNATSEERAAEYVALVATTHALGVQYAKRYGHACCALAKRLLRHEDALFPFVLVAGLSAENKLAERSIRPLVVIRKISGGSRSDEGTKTRMGLASLFATWVARHLNPFEECLTLLSRGATPAVQMPLPQV